MIKVDRNSYKTKKEALCEFRMAMMCCNGSEQERMTFAYCAIEEGCTHIDTYNHTAY